jgi:hypothetical protein
MVLLKPNVLQQESHDETKELKVDMNHLGYKVAFDNHKVESK